MATQEYSPASLMTRGLRVSIEMNGDLSLEGDDVITLSLLVADVQ